MSNDAMFLNTGLEVVVSARDTRISRVFLPAAEAVAWDGAKAETNAAIYSDRHSAYCYAELKITGRAPRTHAGGRYGMKARIRFTGQDDTGEWMDAIVRPVPGVV